MSAMLRVLIVEDNLADARLLELMLAESGAKLEIELAHSFAEATAMLRVAEPDVVLLDLHLPDSAGMETLEKLRAFDQSVPILVMTGSSADSFAVQALGMGAQEFFEKGGCSGDQVLRHIHYAISRASGEAASREQERHAQALIHLQRIGRLAGGLLHEICTPVQCALDNARVLRGFSHRNALTRLQNDTLEDLDRALQRISQLLTEFRGLARPTGSVRRALELNELIVKVAQGMGSNLPWMTVDCTEQNMVVEAVEEDLLAAFANILSNAIEATAGQPEPKRQVRIGTELIQGDRIRVLIEDSGPGIPVAMRERVLEPFYTSKEIGSGLGLGLPLAYSTITLVHGGRMDIGDSRLGGAAFSIDLPLASSHTDEAEICNDSNKFPLHSDSTG